MITLSSKRISNTIRERGEDLDYYLILLGLVGLGLFTRRKIRK